MLALDRLCSSGLLCCVVLCCYYLYYTVILCVCVLLKRKDKGWNQIDCCALFVSSHCWKRSSTNLHTHILTVIRAGLNRSATLSSSLVSLQQHYWCRSLMLDRYCCCPFATCSTNFQYQLSMATNATNAMNTAQIHGQLIVVAHVWLGPATRYTRCRCT